jgi:hypothetical protein
MKQDRAGLSASLQISSLLVGFYFFYATVAISRGPAVFLSVGTIIACVFFYGAWLSPNLFSLLLVIGATAVVGALLPLIGLLSFWDPSGGVWVVLLPVGFVLTGTVMSVLLAIRWWAERKVRA